MDCGDTEERESERLGGGVGSQWMGEYDGKIHNQKRVHLRRYSEQDVARMVHKMTYLENRREQ